MDVGDIFLILSIVTMLGSIIGFILSIIRYDDKYVRTGKYNLFLSFIFVSFASLTLLYYLYIKDFQVIYVATHVDRALSLLYTLTAFYAGAEGSLLLWAWIAMFFAVGMYLLDKKDSLTYLSISIFLITVLFFLVLLVTESSPFKRLDFTPQDGLGLNPLLQDIGMVMHPPLLFIGYAGLAIPFSYVMAGLILRNERWVFRIRKWLIFPWIFLSQGILFGGWWSYRVLGWGGYWAWDPVENASLLPWLTSTALIHSVMIQEARRGLKTWNTLLSIFTYEFVILGTFLTRSGVLASVHAFGQSQIGHHFLVFITVTLIVSIGVLMWRYEYVMETSIDIFEAPFSKEVTFVLNNILFIVAATTIFWGTWFPIINEAVVGTKVMVGPTYYNTTVGPMIWLLVLLMGLCIIIPWRRVSLGRLKERLKLPALVSIIPTILLAILGYSKPEVVSTIYITVLTISTTIHDFIIDYKGYHVNSLLRRFFKLLLYKRRKYGGYIIHLSMLLIVFGLIGTQFYAESYTIKLKQGDTFEISGYTIRFNGVDINNEESKVTWIADIEVYRDGVYIGDINPRIERYLKQDIYTSRVDTYLIPELLGDLYIVFEFMTDDGVASFKVEIMPLIKLLWYSGYVILFGGALALVPRRVVEKL